LEPYDNPFWAFNNVGKKKKKEKEKNLPKIMATFVDASSQGQRTHSARTKNQLKRGKWVRQMVMIEITAFQSSVWDFLPLCCS
jgi:hypothetical protein